MSTDVGQLAARVSDSLSTGSATMPPWLWRPMLQLPAQGEPVTAEDLAQAAGSSTEEVAQALAGLPDTEYDEQGRIVGHGITLNPTPHRFGVPVRLTVEPGKITNVEPETAVVSIVTPDRCSSLLSAFCNHVHFFAGAQAAEGWLQRHPGRSGTARRRSVRPWRPAHPTPAHRRRRRPAGIVPLTARHLAGMPSRIGTGMPTTAYRPT